MALLGRYFFPFFILMKHVKSYRHKECHYLIIGFSQHYQHRFPYTSTG